MTNESRFGPDWTSLCSHVIRCPASFGSRILKTQPDQKRDGGVAEDESQPADDELAAASKTKQPIQISVDGYRMSKSEHADLGVVLATQDGQLVIQDLSRNSAAGRAGIQPGDKLTRDCWRADLILGPAECEAARLKAPRTSPRGIRTSRSRCCHGTSELGSRLDRMDHATSSHYPQGGRLSRRRLEFGSAMQTDAPLKPHQVGTPLIDLQGRVLGVNIARAGRIKSYTVPIRTIQAQIASFR